MARGRISLSADLLVILANHERGEINRRQAVRRIEQAVRRWVARQAISAERRLQIAADDSDEEIPRGAPGRKLEAAIIPAGVSASEHNVATDIPPNAFNDGSFPSGFKYEEAEAREPEIIKRKAKRVRPTEEMDTQREDAATKTYCPFHRPKWCAPDCKHRVAS